MGERYWITGVQLELLKHGICDGCLISHKSKKLVEEIINNQYIGSRKELLKILKEIKNI